MTADKSNFILLIRHPVKFRMFLFAKLPSAFFSGVRVQSIDESKAVVTVLINGFLKTLLSQLILPALPWLLR